MISIPIHSLQNPRILIVDDNEASREDSRQILELDAGAAEDATPVVDLVRMLQITGNDPDMFREIASDYLEQAKEILALMRLAAEKPDLPEIQCLAHKLGGSSACCGMVTIVPHLAKLEYMPDSVERALVGDLLRQVSDQLTHIRRFLTAYSKTLSPIP